ncbi:flagellar biosynthesis protein FlhB [Alicyclobacillus acidiphilus]|uniref:flagellar biosynthesis protein FlhB n=1 Tax=Alicyclobacillus acidiphilus TaxID=182455 RepID=UPI0012EDF880|nr:flagellar biosynthesis protein FlhB [Alicyclobacillus acidiphilus]
MWPLQLQRFAGERTERATPRRRDEARREGNVARSPELTSAVALAAVIVALRVSAPMVWGEWENLMQRDLTMSVRQAWTASSVISLLTTQLVGACRVLLPIVGAGLIVGVAVAVAQVRPMFAPNLIAPKFSRIQPLSGLRRLFGTRSLVELGKSLAKLLIVGAISYMTIRQTAGQIRGYGEMGLAQLPASVGDMVFNLGIRIALAMVLLALFDFLYQRFEYERNLRMTKQQVKDEMKEMEGNPEIKAAIRRRARQIAFRRMMDAVPKADVVITNPTHYAIALRYDGESMAAPQVVAKGADQLAQRIKLKAAESNVPMVENRPLAQSLYRMVDVGESVPAELYQAVAEVLAYVYRLRQLARR